MKNLKNLFRLFRPGTRSISWHSPCKWRAFFNRLYSVSRPPFPPACVTYHIHWLRQEKKWQGGEGWRCGGLKSSSFIFSASEFLPRLSVGGPSELKHLSKITLWIAPKGRVEKIQLAMSSSFFPSFSPAFPEGIFMDVFETKILRLLLHSIHNHLHQLILLSPLWFSWSWLLRSLHQQLKGGGGLALYTLSLCFPVKVALFFSFFLFIYR